MQFTKRLNKSILLQNVALLHNLRNHFLNALAFYKTPEQINLIVKGRFVLHISYCILVLFLRIYVFSQKLK